jgi:hypothetical protein
MSSVEGRANQSSKTVRERQVLQCVRMRKEFGDGHGEMCAAFSAFAEGNIPAAWTGRAGGG